MNPMRNPLLAANLGRWAEVYFTTPPERRAEAIAELIRQLEVESGAPGRVKVAASFGDSGGANEPAVRQSTPPEESWDTLHELSPDSPGLAQSGPSVICVCGHENLMDQRFCGTCGARLQATPSSAERVAESAAEGKSNSYTAESNYREVSFLGLGEPHHNEARAPHRTSEEFPEQATRMPPDELPAFATVQPNAASRYRLYLGAALVILLCTLIYMSWHGKRAFPGSKLTSTGAPYTEPAPAPPSPPMLPTEAPKSNSAGAKQEAGPQPIKNEQSAASRNPPPASTEQTSVPQKPAATPESENAETRRPSAETARPAAHGADRSTKSVSGAAADTGQQELATAQEYLNGTPARDGAEAAVWLWKAVAKGNVVATVELADLYLRGDGVSKNCDQARVLLYAAASKGNKGAAVRLRNLPAFGCQ